MSQLSNAPAPTGVEQAIMEALQKLSEQVQRFQDNLTTHSSQIQGLGTQTAPLQGLALQMQEMQQEQSAQFQGLTVQLQNIHEEQSAQFQSLDERFENVHKSLVEGFRDASESFKITSAEMAWEYITSLSTPRFSSDDPHRRQTVIHARALNLAARNTPYRRISPKPGKPAYEESDFPANAFKVPFMPEDSCDRLARAWGIEFVEGITLDQKRGEVGRFIGCHMPW